MLSGGLFAERESPAGFLGEGALEHVTRCRRIEQAARAESAREPEQIGRRGVSACTTICSCGMLSPRANRSSRPGRILDAAESRGEHLARRGCSPRCSPSSRIKSLFWRASATGSPQR
jgi:hypothetical protein